MTETEIARVRAVAPRGFPDRDAADIAAAEAMMAKIRAVYALYGFEAVETPFVEYTEALGKFLPDQDRPNEGVFSFKDDDEQWLSLRYDLTAPLARYVAENYDRLPKPYRSYRAGWVFRNEKPGPGRFRQFMQFDADTVGAATRRGRRRDLHDGGGCAGGARRQARRLRRQGQQPQGARRRDGGDRPRRRRERRAEADGACAPSTSSTGSGRKACAPCSGRDARTRAATSPRVRGSGPRRLTGCWPTPALEPATIAQRSRRSRRRSRDRRLAEPGSAELAEIVGLVEAGGAADRVIVDPSVVRGLEYYTGPVFEAELTFEVRDEAGRPVRFGSVGGGGRYDGLVARFRAEPVPATGFSIGVSRLLAALARDSKPDRRGVRDARSRRRARARPRRQVDGELPAPRRAPARRRHRRRALSWARPA